MKYTFPFICIALLMFAAHSETPKSDIVAVYNIDSVQQGNTRCAKEDAIARNNYERSKNYELKKDPLPIDPTRVDKKQQRELSHVQQEAQDIAYATTQEGKRKAVYRDSIYWKDSIPAQCHRRMILVSEDFRKTFGYKKILTTTEYATYKSSTEGLKSKYSNVTVELTYYANHDTVAAKYR